MSFSSHFRNFVFVVFGDQVTKILHNSLFTFFIEQGKTGKNGIHGNENLATYFWYFGSSDEKRKMPKTIAYSAPSTNAYPGTSTTIFYLILFLIFFWFLHNYVVS